MDRLATTVKNTSGYEKKFEFLPPHGKTLAAGEEYTFVGHPLTGSRKTRVNSIGGMRATDAFKRALLSGDLEVISSPKPVLYDPTTDETMVLTLDNGQLLQQQPVWAPLAAGEPLRLTGNINALWGKNNYDDINDEIFAPHHMAISYRIQAVDADDDEEQAYYLESPAEAGAITAFRLWIGGNVKNLYDTGSSVRLRINGTYTDPYDFSDWPNMNNGYMAIDFTGVWYSPGISLELYLQAGTIGKLNSPSIYELYVETNPTTPTVMRPIANLNTLWSIYDYTNLDSEALFPAWPNTGSYVNAVADTDDNEEQIWRLGNLPADATKLRVFGWESSGWDLAVVTVKLKVGSTVFDPQAFDLIAGPSSTGWIYSDFTGSFSEGEQVDLYINSGNMTFPKGIALPALYVEVDPYYPDVGL